MVFDQNFAQKAFDACGYDFEYIHGIDDSSRDDYLAKIKQSIDNRIPVLCRGLTEPGPEFCCICGYDDNDLLYLVCEKDSPVVYPNQFTELIFVGERKERPPLNEVYRKTVLDIPSYLTRPSTEEYSFGKQAFIDWAESFQNGTLIPYLPMRLMSGMFTELIFVWREQTMCRALPEKCAGTQSRNDIYP